MKVRGPLVTLGAVAALGIGIWAVNVSQRPEAAAPVRPAAESPTTTVATPSPQRPTPRPPAFPAWADYVGAIPTGSAVSTMEITVDGSRAIGYTCDGYTVEVWLAGAGNGVMTLADKANTSRLEGHVEGTAVAGTLGVGEKQWDFTAAPGQGDSDV